MSRITVLLVDDHPVYRDGLRLMLENDTSLDIVGEESNGKDAVERLQRESIDVVLMDVNMPEMDGLAAAAKIQELKLKTSLILVTMHKDGDLLQRSLDLGVKGYLLKDSSAREIMEAILRVYQGECYMSPSITNMLVNRVRANKSVREDSGLGALTKAELKVLRLVASDRISKEIADELELSVRTVEGHRARICKKLGLVGAHSLVKFAFKHRAKL